MMSNQLVSLAHWFSIAKVSLISVNSASMYSVLSPLPWYLTRKSAAD